MMEVFTGTFAEGIALMLSTEDNFQRNHLAMDLAETGDERVKDALIALIKRPQLKNYRGTLVYALENFACPDQALFLLELVQSGNFEVAAHATNIIGNTAVFPVEHMKLLTKGLQDTASTSSDEWRRDFASELLDTLPKQV